ncbi:hypothetical protein HHI36_007303 [Cryptolaemus montrouzieri]|uniref:Uncharacterized protein n=1 Tax=Cryptolaemus montrouzieri TaxID=559131 RepID=A0ABD2MP58_9CUCU
MRISGQKGYCSSLIYSLALAVLLSYALAYPSPADDFIISEKERVYKKKELLHNILFQNTFSIRQNYRGDHQEKIPSTMSHTVKQFLLVLLGLSAFISISECVKDVEGDPIQEKTNDVLNFLSKLDMDTVKSNLAIAPKMYLLSPEEQKYLEYKRSVEAFGNVDLYETILPYLLSRSGVFQTKTKKNAEMNRGMYNVLNHMDMFNAGKRAFHQRK